MTAESLREEIRGGCGPAQGPCPVPTYMCHSHCDTVQGPSSSLAHGQYSANSNN
jgi:hypothetical protein